MASLPKNCGEILGRVRALVRLYLGGALGGEKMPEDENPALLPGSEQNLLYFTLPMALNYQRDSYKLWAAAKKTFSDSSTRFVFDLAAVMAASVEDVRAALVKYGVALQPNRHVEIWRRIAGTFCSCGVGGFFASCGYDVLKVKAYIAEHKKDFPYLSGPKILNYWLYVMGRYGGLELAGREHISVAPDTHVIQASVRLGLITPDDAVAADARERVAELWRELLEGSGMLPIDVHTPLWLWSRGGFRQAV
ncbi:MAG: hypothetical protein LBL52_03220 [Rickettsiales bacterium]|nr:hypothetical protein [Rickettsiales bacterium]